MRSIQAISHYIHNISEYVVKDIINLGHPSCNKSELYWQSRT